MGFRDVFKPIKARFVLHICILNHIELFSELGPFLLRLKKSLLKLLSLFTVFLDLVAQVVDLVFVNLG